MSLVLLLALWGVQALVLFLVGSALAVDARFGWFFLLVVCGPVVAIPLGWGIHTVYSRLQTWALGYAMRHAFRPD